MCTTINGIKTINDLQTWAKNNDITLVLPNLQREYVWEKEHWGRLWDDVCAILSPSGDDKCPQHFMGVLTLKAIDGTDSKKYSVLDGQQRLTTISVLLDYLSYITDAANENRSSLRKMGFFKYKLDYVEDPLHEENETNRYLQVYRFFMDRHFEMNYQHAEDMLNAVLHRLFFMVKVTEADEHKIFEDLNATGKNLEFSDLLLNDLLEKATPDEEMSVKENWLKLLASVSGLTVVHRPAEETDTDPDDEDDSVEDGNGQDIEEVVSSPLKLKKFFNAVNSLSLSSYAVILETVPAFEEMVKRLAQPGFDFLKNDIDTSTDKIKALQTWHEIYTMVVDPIRSDYLGKAYAKELYYLSIWGVTMYIPVIMRVLYRNVIIKEDASGYYSDAEVKAILKLILSSVTYARIILNRKHSDDRDSEKKLRMIDYIYDAYRVCNAIPSSVDPLTIDPLTMLDAIVQIPRDLGGNKADDAIRNYQYNSAGSKLLLALYVDELDDSFSYVHQLEKNDGKAQVEHMVAQNLAKGSFADYGFDVGSIGLPDNLILLSAQTNQSLSNGTPAGKVDNWNKDSFGKLFSIDWKKIGAGFRASQQNKVKKIVQNFRSYFGFTAAAENSATPTFTFTFARENLSYGRVNTIEYSPDKMLLNGDTKKRYLRLSKNKYEIHPSRDTNSADSYYVDAKEKEYDATGLMQAFVDRIGVDPICQWLQQCESLLGSDFKEGSNSVTLNEETFTYSQKMIHTGDFLSSNETALKNVMGRAHNTTKVTPYPSTQDPKLYLCNDFRALAIAGTLAVIYQHCGGNKPFGFWVKMKKKFPVVINGKVIHTPYVNIGDRSIYVDWLENQPEGQSALSAAKNTVVGSATKTTPDKRYFDHAEKSFAEICGCYGNAMKLPHYQRAYVWDERNWSVLLRALQSQADTPHLGTVVLRAEQLENGSLCHYIVDGQQRMTTLTAFLSCLESTCNLPSVLTKKAESSLDRVTGLLSDIDKESLRKKIETCCFDVIYINENAPRKYQYDVFSAINSAGKKLTLEEKIKNYLLMRFPKGGVSALGKIANQPGFAKAFCEYVNGEFIKSDYIYDSFKKIVDDKEVWSAKKLQLHSDVFSYLKGERKSLSLKSSVFSYLKGERKSLSLKSSVWIRLLNILEVSTSDSLLLNWFMRILSSDTDDKQQRIDGIAKKICFVYFLLYVMDRSGNGAKSANSNFPRLIKNEENRCLAEAIVCAQADLPYWTDAKKGKNISEEIWDKYILTLPIYDLGHARIKRFILLMLEYLMISSESPTKQSYTFDQWKANVSEQNKLEIEHIFPSSEKQWPDDCNDLIPATRLNYLENMMLLEGTINKTVKDCMLRSKMKGIDEKPGYRGSKLFMVQHLVGMDAAEVYTKSMADKRIKALKDMICKNLQSLINEVCGSITELDDIGQLDITATTVTAPKNKRVRQTGKAPSEKSGSSVSCHETDTGTELTKALTPSEVKYKILTFSKHLDIDTGKEILVFANGQAYQGKTHNKTKGRIDGLSALYRNTDWHAGDIIHAVYRKDTETLSLRKGAPSSDE